MKKICQLLTKIHWLVYLGLALPVIFGYTLWVVRKSPNLPFAIPETRLLLILLPLTELLILLILFQLGCRSKTNIKNPGFWQLVSIFCIINLVIVTLLRSYFRDPVWAGFARVQLAIEASIFVIALLSILVIFSFYLALISKFKSLSGVKSAVITFFTENLSRIKTFWNQILVEEDHPSTTFTYLFLAVCFFIGLTLRLINLDGFPPYVDEYIHIRNADLLRRGETITYFRAFLPVTVPVFLSYKILGVSLWASRFPMVLLNMLAIFPLYVLTKNASRTFAVFSTILYVISPWLIAVSKTVREYAVVPLLFFTIAALIFDLLDWDGLTIKQFFIKYKLTLFFLVILLAYIVIDQLSIMKVGLAVYGVFGVMAILKLLKQKTRIWIKVTVIIGSLGTFLIALERSGIITRYLSTGKIIYQSTQMYWGSLVNQENYRQWYFGGYLGFAILFISLFFTLYAILIKYNKKNFVILFCFLNFAAVLIYLTFFIIGPTIPLRWRYGALMEYWYLFPVAFFLYLIYQSLIINVNRRVVAVVLVALLIFGLFINFSALGLIFNYSGSTFFPITGEKHFRVSPAFDYLSKNISEDHILMTDILHHYSILVKQPLEPLEIFSLRDFRNKSLGNPLELVTEYPQGYIAASPNELLRWREIPFENFVYQGKSIQYIGVLGDIHLWQW